MTMHRISVPLAAAALALVVGHASAQALTVCMAGNNPPLSYGEKDKVQGLDVRVAQAIATELQRPLKIILFESEYEADRSLTHEVNALLSSGVCELASGFPLQSSDLGPPTRPTARAPDYRGAKRPQQRPWVPLGTLVPSFAYHAVAFGLIVREAARESSTLAEPGDARIGVTVGTMTGSAVTRYRDGKLRPQLVNLPQNQDVLEQLDAGNFDATLISLDRYDAWQLAHPASTLRRAAYVHPLRINIGFVTRSDASAVLAAANRVISRALADGELQRWSAASGTTWIAPVEPQVGARIGLMDLLRE